MPVLITGASGGLGPAVVDEFLNAGATVYGVARSWHKGNPHNSTRFHVIEADVNTDEGCDTAVQAASPIEALIHLVGGWAGGKPVAETDDATFDRMINLNLRSAFRMMRAALPGMQAARQGRIVVIGSRAAVEPVAASAAYNASKAALASLVRTAALENKNTGVTINLVSPADNRHASQPRGHAASRPRPLGQTASDREINSLAGVRRRRRRQRRRHSDLRPRVMAPSVEERLRPAPRRSNRTRRQR